MCAAGPLAGPTTSVVTELLENAVDDDATRVAVSMEVGGERLLRPWTWFKRMKRGDA